MAEDRLFNPRGRQHFRKRYSYVELRWSALVLVVLGALAVWIVYRGAHPDPELFDTSITLTLPASATLADRGPVPEDLAAEGFGESNLRAFGPDTLYEKINGREGYYKSFGFKRLYTAVLKNENDPMLAVDIELFDLGSPQNALGAYAGERGEGMTSTLDDAGLHHRSSNALFLARGRYYLRAIGPSVDPLVQKQLDHLFARFGTGLEAAPLPWAYRLFVGALEVEPGEVSYARENAFSFDFATGVWSTLLADETEVFVTARASVGEAETLASQFEAGFASYGTPVAGPGGQHMIRDRYIEGISAVQHEGTMVWGVRGASSVSAAVEALTRLGPAVRALGPVEAEAAVEVEAAADVDSDAPSYGEGPAGGSDSGVEPETYGANAAPATIPEDAAPVDDDGDSDVVER